MKQNDTLEAVRSMQHPSGETAPKFWSNSSIDGPQGAVPFLVAKRVPLAHQILEIQNRETFER